MVEIASSVRLLATLSLRIPCWTFAQSFRQRQARHLHFYQVLDVLHARHVTRIDERVGVAGGVGAGCTANAVHIVLSVAWSVIVYDHLDALDVDAAAHNVGRHKDTHTLGAELHQSLLALALIEVGRNAQSLDAMLAQRLHNLPDHDLG